MTRSNIPNWVTGAPGSRRTLALTWEGGKSPAGGPGFVLSFPTLTKGAPSLRSLQEPALSLPKGGVVLPIQHGKG